MPGCTVIGEVLVREIRGPMKPNLASFTLILVVGLGVASCYPSPELSLTPAVTLSSLLTPTLSPTLIASPVSTDTPLPSPTALTLPSPPLPQNTPLPSWNGIPVMEGALAGEEGLDYYAFLFPTGSEAIEEIKMYYAQAMADIGWTLLAVAYNDEFPAVLIFEKGGAITSIAIVPGNPTQVMIVKVR